MASGSGEIPEQSEAIALCAKIQNAVKVCTMSANSVAASDFTYFSTFGGFSKVMHKEGNAIVSLMTGLIGQQQIKRKAFDKTSEFEDKFDILCDVNDYLFDRVGNLLDEAEGLKKRNEELVIATLNTSKNIMSTTSSSIASWNKTVKRKQDGSFNLLTSKAIQRPQLKFKDKVNNSNSPFIPIITYKPNSIKPLSILPESGENEEDAYCHVYEVELEKFEPTDQILQHVEPIKPQLLEKTPLHMVTTAAELEKMCYKLKSCKEIAVDLEHHSYRTFQGFTCLIQISTREEDYLVDALELRSSLHSLNEVFTDTKIVKVFHGADMDIVWLQRDFGVYVVNLFDSGQAARVLQMAHFSLAFLLKHYLSLDVNKAFQLADWRMRPLNADLLKYAREDTHYLLYIYDVMKNELIAKGNKNKNLLKSVFERSKQVCLKKYEKPLYRENSFMSLVLKSRSVLNTRQLDALKSLYHWRDRMARVEDESTGFVLPNHMMLQIAEVLPREQQGILACCNPVPPLVKQQLNELHLMILRAREVPLDKGKSAKMRTMESGNSLKHHDFDNSFLGRHDTHLEDVDQNLETLLDREDAPESGRKKKPQKTKLQPGPKSSLSCFFENNCSLEKTKNEKLLEKLRKSFVSPYERYQKAIEDREKQDIAEEAAKIEGQTNRVESVRSHFMKLVAREMEGGDENESDDGKKEENEETGKGEGEETLEKEGEPEASVRDMIRSTRKKKGKPVPDISCNRVATAVYKVSRMSSSSEQQQPSTSSSEPKSDVKPFDYNACDYKKFSSSVQGNSKSFDPHSKQDKKQGSRNSRVKRKTGKSFTYSSNKKFKS